MAADKYRSPPQPLLVWTTTPDSILADAQKIIDQTKAVLDKLVAEVTPDKATFANVLEPILQDENSTVLILQRVRTYQYFSPDQALRDASSTAEELLSDFDIECTMREDVFKLVDAVFAKKESESLSKEQLHILEKMRRKYVDKGLLLPAGPERDRFKDIQKRLSQLCIQAQKNINENVEGMWFAPEELEGAPADDINIDKLKKGTGENEGKVWLTFKYNHFTPLMQHVIHEGTRREYMIRDSNKVSENVPIFKEVVELRDEAARILGFSNHAEFSLGRKMAKTPATVMNFLNDLKERLAAGGKEDTAKKLEYKKADYEKRGVPFDGNLYMWDSSYYDRIVKENEYSVDEIEVSQYFPVQPTFDGMLKIFEGIFGFVFVSLTKEDLAKLSSTGKAEDVVWHEDVRVYSVWDEEAAGGGFCGYLSTDLYPRDGKFSHNACFDLQSGFLLEDGSRRYCQTGLICNFSKPTGEDKPALLKHNQVVTMFHELGHGIHDLSARTRYAHLTGAACVDDFNEAPSQMLENWCWTPSVLKSLSSHWKTGESIPEDLVQKVVAAKKCNRSSQNLGQLQIAIWDMTVHGPATHEVAKDIQPGRLWNQFRHEIAPTKGPEDQGMGMDWGNRHASIGHFIGGYDAGYYGYLWAEVFSTDMFQTFFKDDPMDGEQGRRYRQTVLRHGGSIDEMEFLREFMGREPSTEAFYKELGLANKARA